MGTRPGGWGDSFFESAATVVALTEIDRELLKRCLTGDSTSWKDFVDRFLGLFIHVVNHTAHARSVRIGPDDIDDLCSEIFVELVDKDFLILRQFRGNSSLATYLAVIARRIVVREMSRRRMAEALGHVPAHQSALDLAGAVSPELPRIDDREEVQRMLDGLPELEAMVVQQFHLEGRNYREISTGLGIPENSIGPTLTRARARLRGREVRLS
jgi:RNA polymerase sigma-70 factor, ECF subfamily